MVADLQGIQFPGQALQRIGVTPPRAVTVDSGVEFPRGGLGMDRQHANVLFPLRQKHPDAGDRIVETPVVLPPRLMVKGAGGEVPLPQSPQGVPLQMGAEIVDAVGHLLLVDPAHPGEVARPAGHGKTFSQKLFLPVLCSNRRQLHRREGRSLPAPEVIHAGHVIVAVMRHDRAVAGELGDAGLLQQLVPRQLPVVGVTPLPDLPEVVLRKKSGTEPPETDPHRRSRCGIEEKFRQFLQKVDAVFLAVLLLEDAGPEDALTAQLGFVREDPPEMLHQRWRKGLVIALMRDAQKLRHNSGVHVVHVVGIDLKETAQNASSGPLGQFFAQKLPSVGGIEADGVLPFPGAGGIDHFVAQILLLILHSETVDQSAAEAGGPAVLIVKPAVHAKFRRFVETGFHAGHPFGGEVFGLQSASGVHEKTADPGLVHLTDLPAQFCGVQFFVPAPEGRRTVMIRNKVQFKVHSFSLFHTVSVLFRNESLAGDGPGIIGE